MTEENEALWGRLTVAYKAAQEATHRRSTTGVFIHVSKDILEQMRKLAAEAGVKVPFAAAESLFCGVPVVVEETWADGLIQVRTIQAIA